MVSRAGFTPDIPMRELVTICLPICSDGTILVAQDKLEELSVSVIDPHASRTNGYDVKMPVRATAGTKLQGFIDAKGLICPMPNGWMPHVRFADGSTRRADVVISLNSKSHHQVAHTIHTLALTAAAERLGGLVVEAYDANPAIQMAIASGLYREDCLVEVEDATGNPIGRYPGGLAGFGVHSQIPSRISKVHKREPMADTRIPTIFESGGLCLAHTQSRVPA